MSFNIQVSPSTQLSIEETFSYYKNKVSPTIAKKFTAEISKAYNSLSINPFYQIRLNNYRAYPLKKFPFIIFYEVDEDLKEVKIIAIFNTKKSMEKYPK